jgi:hypothetical protein
MVEMDTDVQTEGFKSFVILRLVSHQLQELGKRVVEIKHISSRHIGKEPLRISLQRIRMQVTKVYHEECPLLVHVNDSLAVVVTEHNPFPVQGAREMISQGFQNLESLAWSHWRFLL